MFTHSGNFGAVFYGEWNEAPVALKKLGSGDFSEFEKEAEMLA